MMAYYDFLLGQWQLGKITSIQVQSSVTKAYITQAQADTILATPKSI